MKKWLIIYSILCLMIMSNTSYAMRVVIDPGHGGKDPGAIGVNGLKEKVINLDVSLKLKKELEKRGISVFMTRDDDTHLTLQERAVFANEDYGDIFISIHNNSFPNNRNVKGTLILYYDSSRPQSAYPASEAMTALTPQSKSMANTVLDTLIDKIDAENQGIRASAVYVVRNGEIPSILVEVLFLSNPSDAARLAKEEFRQKAAIGIADGIEQYLHKLEKEARAHWAYDSIASLMDKGIVEKEGFYRFPNKPLTRAQFFYHMDRMKSYMETNVEQSTDLSLSTGQAGLSSEQPVASSNQANINELSFSDLPRNHWAYDTIMTAVKEGYILGYEDGTVRPDRAISRAEMVALFDRMLFKDAVEVDADEQNNEIAGHMNPNGSVIQSDQTNLNQTNETGFIDVLPEKWYYNAVNKLKNTNIVLGVTKDKFEPNRLIRRGEGLAILDRYLKQIEQ